MFKYPGVHASIVRYKTYTWVCSESTCVILLKSKIHLNVVESYVLAIFVSSMKSADKPEIRAYIKTRGSLNIPASKIFSELCEVYGKSAVSFSTVCRWLNTFKNGYQGLKDSCRSGRPKTAITKGNIAAVKNLIDEDGRYTLKYIARTVGVSSGSVHDILTKHLELRKVCARWVPHLLTKAQKDTRVKIARELLTKYKKCDKRTISNLVTGDETWIYYFEPQRKIDNKMWIKRNGGRPIIAKRCQSAKKVLYAIFFNSSGPVVQIPTPNRRSVTGQFYRDVVLKKVKKHYSKQRPKTGIRNVCLLHDNAPAHKSKLVQDYLKQERIIQLPHPPYSPDLSPCDFFLFPKLKKMLSGRRYRSRSAIGSAVFQCLNSIPRADYFAAFESWISRLQKCISVKGEYFEGLN